MHWIHLDQIAALESPTERTNNKPKRYIKVIFWIKKSVMLNLDMEEEEKDDKKVKSSSFSKTFPKQNKQKGGLKLSSAFSNSFIRWFALNLTVIWKVEGYLEF